MKYVEFELNSFASSESSRCKLFAKWQRLCDLRSRFGSEVVFTTFLNARREPIARNLTKISDQYYDEMVIQHYRASFCSGSGIEEYDSNFQLAAATFRYFFLIALHLVSIFFRHLAEENILGSGVLFGFSDPTADSWRLRYFFHVTLYVPHLSQNQKPSSHD